MYHGRFNGTHYEMGLKWGGLLLKNGKKLLDGVPFPITEERIEFSRRCIPSYEKYFPEVLEEIEGIAAGQEISSEKLLAVLLSMYCIMPEQKCSCVAFKNDNHIILARNSDFLTEIEKLYMNCIYKFKKPAAFGPPYSFQGNTTAFVEMEDGVNERGLAIGLTAVWPSVLGVGLNAGMIVRYGLERCAAVPEFTEALRELPIASSQTFTAADRLGNVAVIECNADKKEIRYQDEEHHFVSAVNSFHLDSMKQFNNTQIDNWNAEERYQAIQRAFEAEDKRDPEFAKKILSGRFGFMCRYERDTGKDTVWSVIYDLKELAIYRCEGNPSRRKFIRDKRFALLP